MAWKTPITDRTQADVDRVDELNDKWLDGTITSEEMVEFSENMKGALNFEDLERIQGNMQVLSDSLDLGLTITTPYEDLFRQSLLDEIINNVDSLKTAYPDITSRITQDTPSDVSEYAHYTYWNFVEKVQNVIYTAILNTGLSRYAGTELYTGDSIGLLL